MTDKLTEAARQTFLTIDDLTTLATNETLRAGYLRQLRGQLNLEAFENLAELSERQAEVYRNMAQRIHEHRGGTVDQTT